MKTSYTFLFIIIFFLTACSQKIDHHPKHPDYTIKKPKVIYTPSKKNLDKMVKKLQGTPYVWAEEGPDKFDCSGFTYYLYGSMGINIPRVARHQARSGKRITVQELQYGDLIFFATSRRSRRKITHVGMYLGEGWFTHASTVKNEVIYSNLFTSPYYKQRLRVCRRYLPDTPIKVATKTLWETEKIQPKPIETPTVIEDKKSKKTLPRFNKAIVIKAPIHEIEQTSKEGNFYVQVGSFIGKPKSTLLYKITREGFDHKIIQFPKEGQSISKLLIGPYISRDSATNALIQVRAKIQPDAFIAEIR
jgi:hypothetical protein